MLRGCAGSGSARPNASANNAAFATSGRDARIPATPVPAREAPGAIYQDAIHPLAVVRASLDNWSEAELAALAVGMKRAREACDAAKPDDYRGEDLYDFAHLCAFGQDWSPANEGAQKYMGKQGAGA